MRLKSKLFTRSCTGRRQTAFSFGRLKPNFPRLFCCCSALSAYAIGLTNVNVTNSSVNGFPLYLCLSVWKALFFRMVHSNGFLGFSLNLSKSDFFGPTFHLCQPITQVDEIIIRNCFTLTIVKSVWRIVYLPIHMVIFGLRPLIISPEMSSPYSETLNCYTVLCKKHRRCFEVEHCIEWTNAGYHKFTQYIRNA